MNTNKVKGEDRVESDQNEEFIKYASIPYIEENQEILDEYIKAYEKADGSNVQLMKENFIVPGSRSKPVNKRSPPELQRFSNWAYSNGNDLYLGINDLEKSTHSKYVLFGEWFDEENPHTITYPNKFTDSFYLIDLYDRDEDEFIDYEKAKDMVDDFSLDDIEGFKTLDLIVEGNLSMDEVNQLLEGSNLGIEKKEGVLLKNYKDVSYPEDGSFDNFAKAVNDEFKDMREGLSLEDSRKADSIANLYAEKMDLDQLEEELRENGYRFSSTNRFDNSKALTEKIMGKIDDNETEVLDMDRNEIERFREDELYRSRFEQALQIRIMGKKGWI